MSVKTYLQEQIRLVSLLGYDLYTDEELKVLDKINEQNKKLDQLKKENNKDKDLKQEIINEKSQLKKELDDLVKQFENTPRKVRLKSAIYYPKNADYPFPDRITYKSLKSGKRIAEFCCELSRAMGLEHLDCTLDLVVIRWKTIEVLRQLVMNGFYMPIQTEQGIVEKHFRFLSASAGQLRRDKVCFISDEAWDKVYKQLECGMSWDMINERGGLNVNKYMAYLSLNGSATEEWTDFDIDRCIVIGEFEAPVTDKMMYIKSDYTYEIGERTVMIDHTDGCGMMLPEVSMSNFMVRAPWIKGLLCCFDFIRWCKVNNIEPVITDLWGKKHNLIKENITIILTSSMFKLYKLYKDWEEYKYYFKLCNCHFCKTNYEEEYIQNTYLNYQMLQTLQDMTDDEIAKLTAKEHERIDNIGKNKNSMLEILKADEESEQPYKAALAIYPELLREVFARDTLKNIRRKMLADAKSGRIKCDNKRLFVIPDLWAACEFWFMGNKNPNGLLANNEIACKLFRRHDKADVLRSPH